MKVGKEIVKIFTWAWEAGLEVELKSRTFEMPRFAVTTIDGNDLSLPRVDADYPVLVFKFRDRSMEVMAQNWSEMMRRLSYEQKRIFTELRCPEMKVL